MINRYNRCQTHNKTDRKYNHHTNSISNPLYTVEKKNETHMNTLILDNTYFYSAYITKINHYYQFSMQNCVHKTNILAEFLITCQSRIPS